MRKYMGFIVVAVFLLSILLGVFWNEIIQVDAIATGLGIIVCLLALFFFLYMVGRRFFYDDRIDWSKPNVFVRPFLPPIGSEKPHRLTDQNELERKERPED